MNTAMQELIEFLDERFRKEPNFQTSHWMTIKEFATELLKKENDQITQAFKDGQDSVGKSKAYPQL